MRAHVRLFDHVRGNALPIAVLAGLAGAPCCALAQPSQIIIDDTGVF